jgi:hypothetical protein
VSTVEAHLCGAATVWIIKNQKTVSLRTTESELNAISQAVRQALYMRKLFEPLQIPTNLPIQIDNNNHGAIANVQSRKSTYTGLRHHYDVKIKHAHDLITRNIVNINYCPTDELRADLLTKALPKSKLVYHRERFGLKELP